MLVDELVMRCKLLCEARVRKGETFQECTESAYSGICQEHGIVSFMTLLLVND
jgi:hypothetical protein